MKNLLSDRYLNNKGQTAVEYILMILMMASIITSLTVYMKKRYLGDPEKCLSAAQRQLLLCKIDNFINPQAGNKRFQYFPFKK